MSARNIEPSIGQLRRQVVLGTEAVYRVVGLTARSVQVEVVRAPGLTPGDRYMFTRAAVLRMDVLDLDEGAAGS
jgi:hypothetical protein